MSRTPAPFVWGSAACLVVACADPPARPRPVEIPISDYRVEGAAPPADKPAASGKSATTPSPATKGPATVEPPTPKPSDTEVPIGPSVKTNDTKAAALDLKGGFLGATFGSTPRAHRGLTPLDARSETFRAPAKSYGGIALRDVLYMFRKGKLATIQFSLKSNDDCKPMRDALTRELGTPQRATQESATWRGDKVGLRFVISSSGACSATVVSRDFARMEFDSI